MTRRYLMIGAPVTYARTPTLLTEHLARRGIAVEIATRHVEPAELGGLVAAVAADRDVDGLLVTMPHKKTIVALLDALTGSARAAGSVNAVKRLPDGRLAGAQFDGAGLVNALAAARVPLARCRVLLAGAGGAGLAIAHAVAAHGCRRLDVVDLDPALAAAAVAEAAARGCEAALHDPVGAPDHDLLINATPLGMVEGDASPFDEARVARARWVADIVADPPRTRLAALAGSAAGLVTGRDMVAGQVPPIAAWLLDGEVEP